MQTLEYPDGKKKVATAIKFFYWWHENKNAPSAFFFLSETQHFFSETFIAPHKIFYETFMQR